MRTCWGRHARPRRLLALLGVIILLPGQVVGADAPASGVAAVPASGVADVPTPARSLLPVLGDCTDVASGRCPEWTQTLERPARITSAFVADLALSADGATAFAAGYGRTGENPYESDAVGLVSAIDTATGAVRWQATIDTGPYVTLAAVDAGASDLVVVTGKVSDSFSDADTALLLAALDAETGTLRWEHTVDESVGADIGRDVVVVPASPRGKGRPGGDTVVVTGWHDAEGGADAYTLAYDADGEHLWTARYSGVNRDIPWALGHAGDRVVVALESHGEGSPYDTDIVTVAYALQAGPKGRELWEHRFDGSGAGAQDGPRALAVSPDGTAVAVAGYANATTTGPPYATDYDAVVLNLATRDGAERWISRWRPADGVFFAPADAVATADRVAFAATIPSPAGGTDMATVALDADDGSVVWTAVESAPRADGEAAHAIAADDSGERIVTVGHRSSSDTSLVYGGQTRNGAQLTAAYAAADGDHLWTAELRESEINNDRGRAVAIAPDGTIVTMAQLTRNVSLSEEFSNVGLAAYR